MGAGRKTVTYDVDTSYQAGIQNFEDRQRNLGSQLYGVIFGEHALLQALCCTCADCKPSCRGALVP